MYGTPSAGSRLLSASVGIGGEKDGRRGESEATIPDMTFHTSLILSFQRMGFVFFRDWQVLNKQVGDMFKCSDFLRI